jgi:hypothetical protein
VRQGLNNGGKGGIMISGDGVVENLDAQKIKDAIENDEKYIAHWQKEMNNFIEQKSIIDSIMKERGIYDE